MPDEAAVAGGTLLAGAVQLAHAGGGGGLQQAGGVPLGGARKLLGGAALQRGHPCSLLCRLLASQCRPLRATLQQLLRALLQALLGSGVGGGRAGQAAAAAFQRGCGAGTGPFRVLLSLPLLQQQPVLLLAALQSLCLLPLALPLPLHLPPLLLRLLLLPAAPPVRQRLSLSPPLILLCLLPRFGRLPILPLIGLLVLLLVPLLQQCSLAGTALRAPPLHGKAPGRLQLLQLLVPARVALDALLALQQAKLLAAQAHAAGIVASAGAQDALKLRVVVRVPAACERHRC